MTDRIHRISTVGELLAASRNAEGGTLIVDADLTDVPTVRLAAGQTLTGGNSAVTVRFARGQDGLQLSTDNTVEGLSLRADADRRAVFNDTGVAHLGRLTLRRLSVSGVVQLLAREQVRGGHVEAHGIDIVSADARGYGDRPKGYGVEVIQGAFTLWNQQTEPALALTADLTDLSAGRSGAPVRGSGIFVSGGGDAGGRLIVRRLETGEIHSDGGIAPGTPDRITGGVFTVYGAFVDTVRNRGPVTTYGPNDMALDNWGTVDRWVVDAKITSYGPSGIGFVNFGTVGVLRVDAPIETFGQGARGFNVYTGTVRDAEFERVVTHADGAVGIQVSQPVGRIAVRRGIETYGGSGDSLVKGVVMRLSAIPLSIKPGGDAREIDIAGGVIAHGEGIHPLELHGRIESLRIAGGLAATSGGFEKI
jgi:hypothetical protein